MQFEKYCLLRRCFSFIFLNYRVLQGTAKECALWWYDTIHSFFLSCALHNIYHVLERSVLFRARQKCQQESHKNRSLFPMRRYEKYEKCSTDLFGSVRATQCGPLCLRLRPSNAFLLPACLRSAIFPPGSCMIHPLHEC